MYLQGRGGLSKSDATGVKWYQKAAAQGDARAQNFLGHNYRRGNGVVRDLKEAVKYFRLAANQGYVDAQNSMAVRYKNGEGVEKDMVKCLAWRIIACEHGNFTAFTWKAKDSKDMTPAQHKAAEDLAKEMIKQNPKLIPAPPADE